MAASPTFLSDDERQTLARICSRLIPADDWPALTADAVLVHLETLRADPLTRAVADRAIAAIRTPGEAALDELMQIAAQVYYGAADSPGAQMVGFVAGGKRSPGVP